MFTSHRGNFDDPEQEAMHGRQTVSFELENPDHSPI